MFKKITIIGVGLIGGSIGMALKKKRLAGTVTGVSRRESSRRKALKYGAVDEATRDIKRAVTGADLVIIAAPVGKIANLAKSCVSFMKKGAILTDVGSVKKGLVGEIERLARGKVNFIGSHPMAGSDRKGVRNASGGIFKGAAVIITKTAKTDKKALETLAGFWKRLGSRALVLSPEKHDRLAALASYLPHAVSFATALSQNKNSLKFAAGSLRDTTRVASSDGDLWSDIFLSARRETLEAISVFMKNLKALERAIGKNDRKQLRALLEKAKAVRDGFLVRDKR